MGLPVVIAAAGGLPVIVSTNGYGLPCTISTNGYGVPVTQSTNGSGLAVIGVSFSPTIQLSAVSVLESAAVNTVVGTLSVSPGTTGSPVFALVDSAGGKFNISGTSLRTNAALDYETATSHTIIVSVTGVSPTVSNATFIVIVTDVVVATPAAPTLTLTSANTDTTPDFTLTGDLALNDTVRFQYSTASDFTGAAELTNAIDAGEDAANLVTFTTGALALGTWYFRARIERPEAVASAWSNTVTDTIISAGYTGPGNVVAGARTWLGLRAYTTAYATGSNPALDLHNNSTGAFVATINILASGALDVATAATVIAGGAAKIGKLYDQTGNGNHFTQSTNSLRPTLTLSGIGSLPVMTFSTSTLTYTTGLASAGADTLSAVVNCTNSGAQQCLIMAAGQQVGYANAGANTVFLYSGAVLSATATDGAWHSIHAVFANPASGSAMNVDGTHTTGTSGSPSIGAVEDAFIGTSDGASGQPLTGKITEMGHWYNTALSSANCSALSANQHSYWGF